MMSLKLQGQIVRPSDKKATQETVNLLRNLKRITKNGSYMFGHQDALAYGVNWKYEKGRSDVKDVTGDYPAVYGWDLGHLELGSAINLDSVPFEKMKKQIMEAYQRGGVITISWHGTNPLTGKSAWDPQQGTVNSILPQGTRHNEFKLQLDKVAAFLSSLRGMNNERIPVLFRPFHEHTGGWFWWGSKTTSSNDYKRLFRFTVNYLRKKRNLHNLLYVYNTGTEFNSVESFLERYPGDDVVDVVSFDTYQRGDVKLSNSFLTKTNEQLGILEKAAELRNKIAVLGEIGYNKIPSANWWTETLMPSISGRKIAYVLLWRNAGFKAKENETEYYVPYPGHPSAEDFMKFYRLPETLFQKDITFKTIYK